jgi:magnesium-transporting ATPase (P-type)
VIPFDAKHRFMATLHRDHEHHAFIFVKGVPEQLLAMCSDQCLPDGIVNRIDPTCWRMCRQAFLMPSQPRSKRDESTSGDTAAGRTFSRDRGSTACPGVFEGI